MTMRRRGSERRRAARSVLMLAGMAGGLLVGPAAKSGAAEDPCPFFDTLCLYDGTSFTGARFNVRSLDPNGTCVSLVEHGWGDRARSAINTNAQSAALFMNDDCIGGPFQVPGNSTIMDFGGFRPRSAWVPK
jgi:hypothetical protein